MCTILGFNCTVGLEFNNVKVNSTQLIHVFRSSSGRRWCAASGACVLAEVYHFLCVEVTNTDSGHLERLERGTRPISGVLKIVTTLTVIVCGLMLLIK